MPGSAQPTTRRRRSWTSPATRSAPRMWLGVERHAASVATTTTSPDASATCSSASSAVVVPYESVRRAIPCWPRHQPSLSERTEGVRPLGDEPGDVEVLHLEPLAVRGEARRELPVADPGAVQERLVEAVRSDAERRGPHRPVDAELRREVMSWSLEIGDVVRFDRLDPGGGPRVEGQAQVGHDVSGKRPVPFPVEAVGRHGDSSVEATAESGPGGGDRIARAAPTRGLRAPPSGWPSEPIGARWPSSPSGRMAR